MENKSKKTSNYRPIVGLLALFLVARITYAVIKSIQQSEEQTKIEKFQAELKEQNIRDSYAYNIDLNETGVLFMKMENEPYPLFYISVLDSTIIRDEVLLPLVKRVIQKNNLEHKIELGRSHYSNNTAAPGEVKYIFNQNFDHILAEKVFAIKMNNRSNLSFEEVK